MSSKNGPPELVIALIILVTVGSLYVTNRSLNESDLVQGIPADFTWVAHLLVNVLGYATVFLPGLLVYKYVRRVNYSGGVCWGLVRRCFGEDELLATNPAATGGAAVQRTAWQESLLLMFYFSGLQVCYLSWGVLQEKVMTQEYRSRDGQDVGHFKDSQFLVFVNRILAFTMSGIVLVCQRQPRHRCPLYKYVFCSFSNIMSSWCQYEALKYVSFPHQVLAKAAKTIPVMLMGKIVSKTKYEYYEYVTAVILSLGMLFFMLDTGNDRATSTVTTFSGVILLCSYITFDSFTSNWQGALFKGYGMRPVQMMCFVNLYSCVFTAVSLLQQGGFTSSVAFMLRYPHFVLDCFLLSVFSAGGQLFIFSTLSDFGPLVFAIITTIRQGFSVLLSCVIYHHQVHSMGVFGLALVFLSIMLRIYCGHRIKTIRSQSVSGVKPTRI